MAEDLPLPATPQADSAPYPAFEESDAFHGLKKLILSPRPPIALIGAGASVKSGYPTWPELLQLMKAKLPEGIREAHWKRNLDDINDAPWTAEIFARDLGDGGLAKLIAGAFASRNTLAEPHVSLAQMPFPHYLTTNFDPCIEEALSRAKRKYIPVSWHDTPSVSNFLIDLTLRDSDPRVVYLHGRYDDDEKNIILTERAYVSRYIASDDARRKLMAIFMTHPVVFVGFSMNDPDLANLMREVTARLQAKPPAHYAIMGYKNEADREATRARMEGKFGVRPVFFSLRSTGDDYANLLPLLNALADRSPAEAEQPATETKPVTVAEFDPEDPHKGRFGGLSEHSGRRLSVVQVDAPTAYTLRLALIFEPLPGYPPIAGPVTFHLHPTFNPSVETVLPGIDGRAICQIHAYGAFTVGVEIAGEPDRKYELDIAMRPELPLWFRQR